MQTFMQNRIRCQEHRFSIAHQKKMEELNKPFEEKKKEDQAKKRDERKKDHAKGSKSKDNGPKVIRLTADEIEESKTPKPNIVELGENTVSSGKLIIFVNSWTIFVVGTQTEDVWAMSLNLKTVNAETQTEDPPMSHSVEDGPSAFKSCFPCQYCGKPFLTLSARNRLGNN